jgi:putative molybdenum carrier protein
VIGSPGAKLARIVSGGQSGVDRAALDFAIARGIPYGGWCPKSGWAEDFPDPPGLLARYPDLRETPSSDTRERTEWNVRDSDATLVLTRSGASSPGTSFAMSCVERYVKPHLIVDIDAPSAIERIRVWLGEHPEIRTLGIGGPRESEAPGIYRSALAVLTRLTLP